MEETGHNVAAELLELLQGRGGGGGGGGRGREEREELLTSIPQPRGSQDAYTAGVAHCLNPDNMQFCSVTCVHACCMLASFPGFPLRLR